MGDVAKLVPKAVQCNVGVKTTLNNFIEECGKESLTGIAIVAVDKEGVMHVAFEAGENLSLLIGAIERMKKRVIDYAEE